LLSRAYTESRFFCFSHHPASKYAGVGTRSWEGTQPGQLIQTGQKDVLYHVTSCSAIKAGEEEEEE